MCPHTELLRDVFGSDVAGHILSFISFKTKFLCGICMMVTDVRNHSTWKPGPQMTMRIAKGSKFGQRKHRELYLCRGKLKCRYRVSNLIWPDKTDWYFWGEFAMTVDIDSYGWGALPLTHDDLCDKSRYFRFLEMLSASPPTVSMERVQHIKRSFRNIFKLLDKMHRIECHCIICHPCYGF